MHTVVQMPQFQKSAAHLGLTEQEIEDIVTTVANHPDVGDEMSGTGGFRKLRVAGRGKGKSGGYRVITFFSGDNIPVLLVEIYSKGDKDNLTAAQRNALKAVGKAIVEQFGKRVVRLRK